METQTTLFRAYQPVGVERSYFMIAYGPDNGLPKTTESIKELAKYIAYYWWRCAAVLETSKDGINWRLADEMQQKEFVHLLDHEFFMYEIH